jgi:hypothetical protein
MRSGRRTVSYSRCTTHGASLWIAIIIVACLLVGSARAADRSDLARDFLALVIGKDGRLNKWTDTVRYSVEGKGASPIIDDMVAHTFQRMGEITGLAYTRSAWDGANFRVHYLNFSERLALLGETNRFSEIEHSHLASWHAADRSPCTFMFTRKGGVILSADIFIKSEFDMITVLWCIKSKVARVHGLLNSIEINDSIFGPPGHPLELTAKDVTFLKVLYSPQLAAGASPDEVKRVASDLLTKQGVGGD